ncbi:MAG: hypothetical protein CMN54_07255 [SAR324 cluster bacterium]|uniref:Uncharacterized protein n=1 Tax=SAR324 cluster bacterium TaxID=2024889 RepID=A0A2D6YJ52_9DELT|nr:hypothetical protein [SAR324 cluster bacterium]
MKKQLIFFGKLDGFIHLNQYWERAILLGPWPPSDRSYDGLQQSTYLVRIVRTGSFSQHTLITWMIIIFKDR